MTGPERTGRFSDEPASCCAVMGSALLDSMGLRMEYLMEWGSDKISISCSNMLEVELFFQEAKSLPGVLGMLRREEAIGALLNSSRSALICKEKWGKVISGRSSDGLDPECKSKMLKLSSSPHVMHIRQ